MGFHRVSAGCTGIVIKQQSNPDMQVDYPTPVMHNSPVVPGVKRIQRNVPAYRFYIVMFALFSTAVVFGCLALLLIWFYKEPDDMILILVEIGVICPQAITFGMAAFQKEWLLEGDVPWKLSSLALCPLLGIIIVGILYPHPPSYTLTGFRIVLYFILAFWDGALPYSYVEEKANSY
jgi:hypothetical protein